MAQPVFEPRRMNADTFFTLPDDGHRYELIDGELEMAPAPSADVHQLTVGELFLAVTPFVKGRQLGLVFLAATASLGYRSFGKIHLLDPSGASVHDTSLADAPSTALRETT